MNLVLKITKISLFQVCIHFAQINVKYLCRFTRLSIKRVRNVSVKLDKRLCMNSIKCKFSRDIKNRGQQHLVSNNISTKTIYSYLFLQLYFLYCISTRTFLDRLPFLAVSWAFSTVCDLSNQRPEKLRNVPCKYKDPIYVKILNLVKLVKNSL